MTKAREEYTNRVVDHGCIVCRDHLYVISPAEAHHVRRLDTSKKRERAPILPLCPQHHRGVSGVGIHSGRQTWEKLYGSELEMAQRIIDQYGEMPR